MTYDKIIEALNELRGEYVDWLFTLNPDPETEEEWWDKIMYLAAAERIVSKERELSSGKLNSSK